MQLGTRWDTGQTPPARLPEPVLAAIAEVEAALPEGERGRWTLTWLERMPVLDHDAGWSIRFDPGAAAVRILAPGDDGVDLLDEDD